MMIAWERSLESELPVPLFSDPLAKTLAGSKGEKLSANFGNMCTMFEFEGWPEFHKTWVAVRTR
jgi:O-methyltransferase involved in polyketide biosynthesis